MSSTPHGVTWPHSASPCLRLASWRAGFFRSHVSTPSSPPPPPPRPTCRAMPRHFGIFPRQRQVPPLVPIHPIQHGVSHLLPRHDAVPRHANIQDDRRDRLGDRTSSGLVSIHPTIGIRIRIPSGRHAGVAPLPPTGSADAASTIATAAPSASACASASPLRSLVDRATDHAVIFISTFLFGDAAWGNGSGDANGKASVTYEDDTATVASEPTPRIAFHASGGRTGIHRRARGLRGVKMFQPSLPSICEDSTTIAVDEAELQQVRAARLVRFDLRMLARSGSFDDEEDDDEGDKEEDHEDEEDANENTVEEKKQENEDNCALVNDAKLQEDDEDHEIADDVPDHEPVRIDQQVIDHDAADNEGDADVPGHPDTGISNFAHFDLLGNLVVEVSNVNAAASTIQRCFRCWMDMKIERLVREWLGAATNDADKDDTSSTADSHRSSSSDASSACSTCTTVSSSTSSTSTTSTTSLLHRSRSSTNVKPKVDSNNGTKRVRQYPISAATQVRRAAQAQQQAELATHYQLDTDRIDAIKAKVQSFNGSPKHRTTPPSALQLAARAIQAQIDAENDIKDARLAAVKPVVVSNNSGKRPQRVSRLRSTPDANAAAIKRETKALEERVRSVQPKVISHRPRPRKQQQ